jgi:hypothetical protein
MFVRHAPRPHTRRRPRFREALFVLFSCAGAIGALNTRVPLGFERRIAA